MHKSWFFTVVISLSNNNDIRFIQYYQDFNMQSYQDIKFLLSNIHVFHVLHVSAKLDMNVFGILWVSICFLHVSLMFVQFILRERPWITFFVYIYSYFPGIVWHLLKNHLFAWINHLFQWYVYFTLICFVFSRFWCIWHALSHVIRLLFAFFFTCIFIHDMKIVQVLCMWQAFLNGEMIWLTYTMFVCSVLFEFCFIIVIWCFSLIHSDKMLVFCCIWIF
jgi:hypothetical protein